MITGHLFQLVLVDHLDGYLFAGEHVPGRLDHGEVAFAQRPFQVVHASDVAAIVLGRFHGFRLPDHAAAVLHPTGVCGSGSTADSQDCLGRGATAAARRSSVRGSSIFSSWSARAFCGCLRLATRLSSSGGNVGGRDSGRNAYKSSTNRVTRNDDNSYNNNNHLALGTR